MIFEKLVNEKFATFENKVLKFSDHVKTLDHYLFPTNEFTVDDPNCDKIDFNNVDTSLVEIYIGHGVQEVNFGKLKRIDKALTIRNTQLSEVIFKNLIDATDIFIENNQTLSKIEFKKKFHATSMIVVSKTMVRTIDLSNLIYDDKKHFIYIHENWILDNIILSNALLNLFSIKNNNIKTIKFSNTPIYDFVADSDTLKSSIKYTGKCRIYHGLYDDKENQIIEGAFDL